MSKVAHLSPYRSVGLARSLYASHHSTTENPLGEIVRAHLLSSLISAELALPDRPLTHACSAEEEIELEYIYRNLKPPERTMANKVFGNPITDGTLKGMPEYKGKQQKWGNGVSTLCLVYNATGDSIKFVTSHDWWGNLGPAPYPLEIANGQWGAFLHVKRVITLDGSNAAVVYRGKNETGHECDWMVAWDYPWNKISYGNKVYTEIREVNYFNDKWDTIEDTLKKMDKTVLYKENTRNGFKSTVTIGDYTSPILEAVLTLAPDA
ncbi:hypothetical protein SLEP1_g38014 [Rubroshorea leprosula]|uniref:23 kDa jasmonate-induced protein-like n=1 Tax=Rubroshorea leprosula TaxID=152421 RepID=A0AAV5KWU0_9ROSI|nr:hypothetical protein SLEP1_g38014 [Rubroshorea leprosula]